MRHPPLNNQRAAAFFLSLGHYDAFMMHMHKVFGERWKALQEALRLYLLHFVETTPAQGGTAIWLEGPPEIAVDTLVQEAAKRGVLIEPVVGWGSRNKLGDCPFRPSFIGRFLPLSEGCF